MKHGLIAVSALAAVGLASLGLAGEVELERPASKPVAETSTAPQAVLTVKADGSLSLSAKPIASADLPAKLKELAKLHKDYSIVLQGDEQVSYKEVVRVLDVCRDAGIWNVSFAVTKTQ